MSYFRRIVLIVLDSVGIGAQRDASRFGDEGADTIGNIYRSVGLYLPNLCRLGLSMFTPLPPVGEWIGACGKMEERSAGKDTTTGHWEIAGIVLEQPFRTYPEGFPKEFIERFEKRIGRKVLWNKPASGTEIIRKLGEAHCKSGDVIVYTSSDSVFQVAAHEEVVPLEELYEICQIARKMLTEGGYQVGRVIARPFIGKPPCFERTPRRRDFSMPPPQKTVLDRLVDEGYWVAAIGKIGDIFAHRGISWSQKTNGNPDGIERTLEQVQTLDKNGLIFTNLIDFDMLYGHRRDAEGYRRCLEEFDRALPTLLEALRDEDLLIITGDHGNDPTFKGTDHTREYTPLLIYHKRISPVNLGVRKTFADIAQTIGENFGFRMPVGESFLSDILADP
ncbi:MAG: phosphopentomutase [Planctomycetota bacterium]|nr:MAG: phosphopentomutase [Planctomycetota bacterium]